MEIGRPDPAPESRKSPSQDPHRQQADAADPPVGPDEFTGGRHDAAEGLFDKIEGLAKKALFVFGPSQGAISHPAGGVVPTGCGGGAPGGGHPTGCGGGHPSGGHPGGCGGGSPSGARPGGCGSR